METKNRTVITVETTLQSPLDKAWQSFTEPRHITQWCQASEDWHAPFAENDLRTGGKFKTTMAAK
ncbi:MAG: SRPBCC domain-containing protein, partial [Flavisolibacter sp.]